MNIRPERFVRALLWWLVAAYAAGYTLAMLAVYAPRTFHALSSVLP